jgi:hypothetical protein
VATRISDESRFIKKLAVTFNLRGTIGTQAIPPSTVDKSSSYAASNQKYEQLRKPDRLAARERATILRLKK